MAREDFVPVTEKITQAPFGSPEHLKKLTEYLRGDEAIKYSKHERTVKTIKVATEILSGGYMGTVADRLALLEALMTHKYREGCAAIKGY